MVAGKISKQSISHCGDQIMEPKYLYTIKWTQTYATYQMRPYLRHLRNEYEAQIEAKLARGEFDDAKQIIERIMKS
jgi:hypothetical protein